MAFILANPSGGLSQHVLAVADAAIAAKRFIALMFVNLAILAKHGLNKAADKLINSKNMSALDSNWTAWKQRTKTNLNKTAGNITDVASDTLNRAKNRLPDSKLAMDGSPHVSFSKPSKPLPQNSRQQNFWKETEAGKGDLARKLDGGTGNVSEGDLYLGGSGGVDATPPTIKYLEDMIKTEEFEHGVVFDRNGNVLSNLITDNHPTKINFSPYKDQIKDAIVTHNHPTNGMFSWQDFETAIAFDAAEIRAALPNGVTFSMKRGPNGWSVQYSDVRDIFDSTQNSFRNNPEITQIYRDEGYAKVNDMLMEAIANEIGGIYSAYK